MKSCRSFPLAIALFTLAQAGIANAQAVKIIPCPEGLASLNRCIASNETCGWRNQRPTAAELEQAKSGGLDLVAPCPTLSNGTQLKHCWIDRVYYCKVPSAAEIAQADKAKREREEKSRQEKMDAERKQAAIASETARLGAHREAEARRLVEMREKAEQARGVKIPGARPGPATANKDPAAQEDAAIAARKRREAQDAARAERERAQAEARKKHEEDLHKHLAAERAGIRLRALKCGGQDTITGIRPAVSPRIANCITVHYEARCPGVPQGQGTRMAFANFVGGNSCYGDTQKLNPPLACKPESAIVNVRSVEVCGW